MTRKFEYDRYVRCVLEGLWFNRLRNVLDIVIQLQQSNISARLANIIKHTVLRFGFVCVNVSQTPWEYVTLFTS